MTVSCSSLVGLFLGVNSGQGATRFKVVLSRFMSLKILSVSRGGDCRAASSGTGDSRLAMNVTCPVLPDRKCVVQALSDWLGLFVQPRPSATLSEREGDRRANYVGRGVVKTSKPAPPGDHLMAAVISVQVTWVFGAAYPRPGQAVCLEPNVTVKCTK